MGNRYIERVLIEEGVESYALSAAILNRLQGVPVHLAKNLDGKDGLKKSDLGKETLHLVSHRGSFLKPCPGTREYICCGYQILNVATNCPLDCSYCILQSYFNQPNIRTFVNLEEELDSVFGIIDASRQKIFRVGTGEFTDSLAMDPVTRWSDSLIPRFSRSKNAVLELKTKTDRIERVLEAEERDRIIISWSLNSPYIVSREEHRAVSLERRLEAAGRCQSEGFVLGFHFDPLIVHPDWKEGYLSTLDLLDRYVDPGKVIWISMGSFRYMPGLKPVIRRRHPNTCVLNGEFIPGLDGKMRYFKPIRVDLYGFMRENLDNWHPGLGLYLCMESDDVWEQSMGWSPRESDGLARFLDKRVEKFFG